MSSTDNSSSPAPRPKMKANLAAEFRDARGASARLEAAARNPLRFLLRLVGDGLWFLIRVAVSILPMAPLGDAKGRVAENEGAWNAFAAWLSALAHLLPAPYFLFLVARDTQLWMAWPLLLMWLALGQFWWARRVSAGLKTQEMTLIQYLSAMRGLLGGSRGNGADGESIHERPAFKQRVAVTATCVSGLAMAAPVAVLVLNAVPNLAPLLSPLEAYIGWAPAAFLAGHLVIALVPGSIAGYTHGSLTKSETAVEATWRRRLALITGVTERAWIDGGGRFEIGTGNSSISVTLPVQLHGVVSYEKIEAEVELRANEWTVVNPLGFDSIELVPIASAPEVAQARAIKVESMGLIVGYEDEIDTPVRPRAVVYIGNADPTVKVTAAAINAYAATKRPEPTSEVPCPGTPLVVEFDPATRRATIATLTAATDYARGRVAYYLRCAHWDVELTVQTEGARTTGVSIHRVPVLSADAEQRRVTWLTIAGAITEPPALYEWVIDDQTANGGPLNLELRIDPLRQVLTYPWSAPVSYRAIPFAVDEAGAPVSLGLLETNQLLGGLPGGGKSGGLTTLLAGISRLEHVALVGLDPKRVELAGWRSRFSRIASEGDDAQDVLDRLMEEMERRYEWLVEHELKKFTPNELSEERPLIVLVIDELADLVSIGGSREEKAEEALRSTAIRRLIAKGRAAGVVAIIATQKPQSDVIPTSLRDLIQQRVAYATSTKEMTDTILGSGMSGNGGLAHTIPEALKGVAYIINETSRTPARARTYWVPDEEVRGIAERTAHLRVALPWLAPSDLPRATKRAWGSPTDTPEIVNAGDFEFTLDELEAEPGTGALAEPPASPTSPSFEFTFDG